MTGDSEVDVDDARLQRGGHPDVDDMGDGMYALYVPIPEYPVRDEEPRGPVHEGGNITVFLDAEQLGDWIEYLKFALRDGDVPGKSPDSVLQYPDVERHDGRFVVSVPVQPDRATEQRAPCHRGGTVAVWLQSTQLNEWINKMEETLRGGGDPTDE